MKYKKAHTMTAILVEPADDATFIANWILRRCDPLRPIVLLLPVNASQVFRTAEYRSVLHKLQAEWADHMALVIPGNAGNERLRSWTSQQGFLVFGTIEDCQQYGQKHWPVHTHAQHGSLPGPVQRQHAEYDANSPAHRVQRTQRRTTGSLTKTRPISFSDMPYLIAEGNNPVRQTTAASSISFATETAWEQPPKTVKRETEPVNASGEMVATIGQAVGPDWLMLTLMVLLLLGILGGVGFSYLLSSTTMGTELTTYLLWRG